MLNYHELTIDEPRDAPARKQQFRTILSIMGACILYSVISSGVFNVMEISKMKFEGGEFVYKFSTRDYAATNGFLETIMKDMETKRTADVYNTLYSVYLDNPYELSGDGLRFGCGLLLSNQVAPSFGDDVEGGESKGNENDQIDKNEKKEKLVAKNKTIIPIKSKQELEDLPAFDLWNKTKYESTEFPSVEVAYVQHPYNYGIVSALVQSYKIIPALIDYAKKNSRDGSVPVVLSTCSFEQKICTSYAPLEQGNKFLLGRKDTEEHKNLYVGDSLFSTKKVVWALNKAYNYVTNKGEKKDEL